MDEIVTNPEVMRGYSPENPVKPAAEGVIPVYDIDGQRILGEADLIITNPDGTTRTVRVIRKTMIGRLSRSTDTELSRSAHLSDYD